MRLAEIATDFWELRSGEQAHKENPETFWIPERTRRESLQRGDGAKLVFDIEVQDESGNVERFGERMWVIVVEKVGDIYTGLLDNAPKCIDPSDGTYLRVGAEIPFKAEHVVDIDIPPKDYAETKLSGGFTQRWQR